MKAAGAKPCLPMTLNLGHSESALNFFTHKGGCAGGRRASGKGALRAHCLGGPS